MSKKEARDIVEKEFQNEMATMKARLETGIPTATVESLNEPKSSMSVKDLQVESLFVLISLERISFCEHSDPFRSKAADKQD
jgi:hypothetical protein